MTEPEQVLSRVVSEVFSPVYQLVAAIAVVYFIYGVVVYIKDLNNPNPQQQNLGKSHLLYGLIGLFIIFSVGGILTYFRGMFGGLFQ